MNPDLLKPITVALQEFLKIVKESAEPFAKLVKESAEPFGKIVKDMVGPFGKLVDQFTQFGKTLSSGLSRIFSSFVEQLKSFQDVLNATIPGLSKASGAFVEAATLIGGAIVTLGSELLSLVPAGVTAALATVSELLGNAATAITAAASAAVAALGAVAAAASGALGAAVALGEAIKGLVEMASPALVVMFTNALDDLNAIVGQALMPVMTAIIPIVRLGADTLATFASTIGSAIGDMVSSFMPVLKDLFDFWGREGQVLGKVFQAIAPVVASIAEVFKQLWEAIEPVESLVLDLIGTVVIGAVQLLAEAMKAIVPIITSVAEAIRGLLVEFTAFLREVLGIPELTKKGEGTKPGASLGAAVKSVSIGSQESVIQQAWKNAFMLGTAGTEKKPEEKTADATEGIFTVMGRIWEWIQTLPDLIWEKFKDALEKLGEKAKGIAGEVVEGGLNAVTFGAYGHLKSVWSDDRKIAGAPIETR